MPNRFIDSAAGALSRAREAADKLRTVDSDNRGMPHDEADVILMNLVMDAGIGVVEAVVYGLLAIASAGDKL